MSTATNSAVIDMLFDPVEKCLTVDVARRLVSARASADVQNRIDALADKCSAGTLTAEERNEYEAIVRTINFIGVLQAKARAFLNADAGN